MPNDDQLIKAYKRAQDSLIRGLSSIALDAGSVSEITQRGTVFAREELYGIAGLANQWARETIGREHVDGLGEANDEILAIHNSAGVPPPPLMQPNNITIASETQDAEDSFLALSIYALGALGGLFQSMSGMELEAARQYLVAYLGESGIPAALFVTDDKEWRAQLDAHGGLLVNTLGFLAFSNAKLAATKYAGGRYVKMSAHAPTCPICYPRQGRVYSVDGSDTRYPPLSYAFPSGYPTVHPNCRHTISPYFPFLNSPEQNARDMAFSNRPLDVSGMKLSEQRAYERQLRTYNAGQKVAQKLSANRRQWQRYTSRLGSDAPSFARFSRLKNANGSGWLELQADYRAAK